MSDRYLVREVRESDLPELVEIEKTRWAREGTEILSLSTLQEWYEGHSPFFLVAEKKGIVEGFYYGMQVDFSMDHIEEFTDHDARTELGYTKHKHNPQGRSVYGVNVVTIAPEAGFLLNAEVHQRVRFMHAEYFLGFTRLVHLDHYLSSVEAVHLGTLPYEESSIALWYAHQTMKLLHGRKWDACSPEPDLDLPALRRPDTIVKFHVADTTLGLLRVVANYMQDKKSRNYGAFFASDEPHFTSI